MSPPRLAAIVHGARWPAWDAGATWRERLSRALQVEVEIILARVEPSAPRGAATAIAQGLGRTLAPHVLVIDVHAEPDDEREMFGLQREILAAFAGADERR